MCAVWAGGRAAQLAWTGLYGEKKALGGHPGAVRLLWCSIRRDAELGSRAVRASCADGPQGWPTRVQMGHWKSVTGIRAPGGLLGRSFVGPELLPKSQWIPRWPGDLAIYFRFYVCMESGGSLSTALPRHPFI